MGKYSEISQLVFSLFDSVTWKATNLKAYPNNYVAKTTGEEFLRVTVILGGGTIHNIEDGVINIEIFTRAGMGFKRIHVIADLLDNMLKRINKPVVSGAIQTFDSSLGQGGYCPDDKTLYKTLYTIPFKFFEVTK